MPVEPPRPRMPSLNALRAFEAAARTGSFTGAAAELNVTPAAVAQQVKGLEAWLGCELFVRLTQGLRLSERGQAALPSLVHAFDSLGVAVHELNRVARPGQVTIAALPAVATLWLAPQLAAMREAFPALTVSIAAMEAPPNMLREPYDLALFYLDGSVVPPRAVILHADRIAPLCSPAIAPRSDEEPAAWLRRQTLLHDTSWLADWETWLRVAGVSGVASSGGPRFSLYSLAVQAAQEGAGVLMGHAPLLARALRNGDLVAPFDTTSLDTGVTTGRHLVATLPGRPEATVQRLALWLAGRGKAAA